VVAPLPPKLRPKKKPKGLIKQPIEIDITDLWSPARGREARGRARRIKNRLSSEQ